MSKHAKVSGWYRDYAAPHCFARARHFTTPERSMIYTLTLENGRRDSLHYLRVTTVFELLRLVEQAVETGFWTHIDISKI